MTTKIGFIGTGIMGGNMAAHIMGTNCTLYVYNRSKNRAKWLVERGAIWVDTPAEIAKKCDIVFTIVGYPQDVREIYMDEKRGLLRHARPGSIFVDMTTSTPSLAVEIDKMARTSECYALDAPVTGGDIGAQNGTLTIFAGGNKKIVKQIMPLLKAMGKNVVWMGEAGSGQHAKMCNQIAIASTMLGVCESIRYAQQSGLDVSSVIETISQGAAGSWSLTNYGPRILNGDFAPGFFIKHFIKDMKIALDEAKKMDLFFPGLELAEKLYEELDAGGMGEDGIQALYRWYVKR